MGSKEQELLQDKSFINKGMVIKAEPMEPTFEILSVVPNKHSLQASSIHTVMMQPVASELEASLPTTNKTLNPFKCDFCGKQFKLASRLKMHAKIHSNNYTIIKDPDKERWSSHSSGGKQDNSATGRSKSTRNIKSGLKFKTNKDMKGKVNRTDNNNITKPNVKLTNYRLKTNKDMKSKISKTDNDNKTQSMLNAKLTLNYQCTFCDKQFATPAHLSRHTRVHTRVKPFTCGKCNKTFKDASVLTRHLRIHSNDRRYCCKVCKKLFIQSKDLQHHLRSHSGDQPYQCETCYKCFTSASYLTVHNRTHTGIKPYVCPVCNAGFQASGTLARHRRSHSTEKQYNCSECPKAFTRSTNLKLHIQAHHSNGNN